MRHMRDLLVAILLVVLALAAVAGQDQPKDETKYTVVGVRRMADSSVLRSHKSKAGLPSEAWDRRIVASGEVIVIAVLCERKQPEQEEWT